MPLFIKLAVFLIALFSGIQTLLAFEEPLHPVALGVLAIVALILTPILCGLWAGRNWARIVILIAAILNILTAPFGIIGSPLLLAVINALDWIFSIGLLVLLTSPAIKDWFSQPKMKAASAPRLPRGLIISAVILVALGGVITYAAAEFRQKMGLYRLWQESLEDGKVSRLPIEGIATTPSISPDGKSILYVSSRKNLMQATGRAIALLDVASGESRVLIDDSQLHTEPSWCGDEGFTYASDQGGRDIWFYLLKDGSTWRLTNDAAFEAGPRCSPDGTQVAFLEEGENERVRLGVVSVKGGAKDFLTSDSSFLRKPGSPGWSLDSKELYYFSFTELKGVDLKGRETLSFSLTGLNNFMIPMGFPARPDWIFFKARQAAGTSLSMDLYLVSRKTGEVRTLAERRNLMEMGHTFSRDGRYMVYARPE